MRRLFLPMLLAVLAFSGHAQKDTIRKYLDADFHFTGKRDFVYPALAIRREDHWMLYAVYPDTSIVLKVSFKNAAFTIKDGPYEIYHPKNVPAQKGNFVNNVPEGHWQTFYPGGQPEFEGDVIHNHYSGKWESWYPNGSPKSLRHYVFHDDMINSGDPIHENAPGKMSRVLDDFSPEGTLDGAVSTWFENGNKESEVNYKNDSLEGRCAWFWPNGKPSTVETYKEGKVIDLACFDSTGKNTGSTCSILKLPVLIHPFFNALDYIENELHKDKHRGVTAYGDVQLRFTITTSGKVKDLQVVSSPDAVLSRLITDIFKTMPAWSPAVTHNRQIEYPMVLVVPYYGD